MTFLLFFCSVAQITSRKTIRMYFIYLIHLIYQYFAVHWPINNYFTGFSIIWPNLTDRIHSNVKVNDCRNLTSQNLKTRNLESFYT